MPPTVTLDVIAQGVELEERDGIIVRMVRGVRVAGLTPTGDSDVVDEALDAAGVPQPWSYHEKSGTVDRYDGLLVVGRRVGQWHQDGCILLVEYGRKFQQVDESTPEISGFIALEQVETSRDRTGTPIVVGPAGAEQGGRVNVAMPRRGLSYAEVYEGNSPGAAAWAGYVNDDVWNGGAAGTWRCEGSEFEYLGKRYDGVSWVNQWRRRWTFVYNPLGWQPIAEWLDPSTGKPSDAPTASVHYKTVDWYPEADFGTLFPL